MARAIVGRRVALWLLAGVCILSLWGCAQPQPTHKAGGNEGLLISDPNHRMSSEHWEYYPVPKDRSSVASVVARARDGEIAVLCREERELALIIRSNEGAALKNTSIRVTFDGNMPLDRPWMDTTNEDGWGIGLIDSQENFWSALAALKQHQTMEVVVSESGKEWRRLQFTLVQADEAINLVLKQCGMEDRI